MYSIQGAVYSVQGAVETRVVADVCLYPALQHYRTGGGGGRGGGSGGGGGGGKYQNCHLVFFGSFWFFLVLFLVL